MQLLASWSWHLLIILLIWKYYLLNYNYIHELNLKHLLKNIEYGSTNVCVALSSSLHITDIKSDNKPLRAELHTSQQTSNQTWPWHYKYLKPAHTDRIINALIDLHQTKTNNTNSNMSIWMWLYLSQTIAATLKIQSEKYKQGNVRMFFLVQNDNCQWTRWMKDMTSLFNQTLHFPLRNWLDL